MNGFDPCRKNVRGVWSLLLLLCLSVVASAHVYAMTEDEKIMALIASVKDTPEGTKFIRNGKAHSVDEAVSHLMHKYSRAKSKVKTAEAFIKHVASGSSVSGKAYLIRYPDETTVTAVAFFTERLRKLERKA